MYYSALGQQAVDNRLYSLSCESRYEGQNQQVLGTFPGYLKKIYGMRLGFRLTHEVRLNVIEVLYA